MTEKKYKLTISILASNRKDTFPKTLESIKPILDNVSSELIITDTGCDDELLGEIRKYTDKIINFQWCNDFSKARNVGLSMAQGEWFMFLDDDEWFENVEEIINFFNEGECEKYNLFHYLQRNYADMGGTVWQDNPVERGVRLIEGMSFVDSIHEHFSEVTPPIKLFNCYVHHYGYVYKNDEERKLHFERNYKLLTECVKKHPKEIRYYSHIINGCNNIHNYEASLEWTRRALDMVNESYDKKDKTNLRDISSLYANVVHCEFFLDNLEEAIEQGEGYLKNEKLTELAQCIIHSYLSNSYMIIMEEDKAFANLKKYFELYEYLNDRLDLRMAQAAGVTAKACTWTVLNRMWYFGMMKVVNMEDEEKLLYLMDKVKYLHRVESLSSRPWQVGLIKMMSQSKQKRSYVQTFVKLLAELNDAKIICEELLRLKEVDEQLFLELVSYLVDNDSESIYIKALRNMYFSMTGQVEKLKEINNRIAEKH